LILDVNRAFDESFKKFEAGVKRVESKHVYKREEVIGWLVEFKRQIQENSITRAMKERMTLCFLTLTPEQSSVVKMKYQLDNHHNTVFSNPAIARHFRIQTRSVARRLAKAYARMAKYEFMKDTNPANMSGAPRFIQSVDSGLPAQSTTATSGGESVEEA